MSSKPRQIQGLGPQAETATTQLRDFVSRLSNEEAQQVEDLLRAEYAKLSSVALPNHDYRDVVVTKVTKTEHKFQEFVATVALGAANFVRQIKKLVVRS